MSALKVQQSGELAEAKERAVNAQQEANQKHEQDRARIVQQHDAGMTEMRTAHAANEARIAKLTAASHELQLQVRLNTKTVVACFESYTYFLYRSFESAAIA